MKTYIDNKHYWVSSAGFLGESFLFNTLDLEIEEGLETSFDGFLKPITKEVRVKVSLFEEFSKNCHLQSERVKAVSKKGFLKTTGLIHFEHRNKISFKEALKTDFLKKEEHFTKRLSKIKESKDNSFLNRLGSQPISSSFFKELYNLYKPLEITSLGLKSCNNLLGVLKLKNSGNYALSLQSLPLILEKIPKPLGFHISIEKMSPMKGEKTLRGKSREEAEGRGEVSFQKYRNTQKALRDVELAGEELFHYEVHITLRRLSEEILRRDIAQTLKALTPLGEWSTESFGAYPSLLSLSPGSNLHYRLIEKSSTLKCFLPFSRFGASILEGKREEGKKLVARGSLLYHRRDLSLDTINPFSPSYSNHTGVIIGKSGKGKSVFANLLTKSLFFDERASIFLVDVKGSHKKTVKALGGKTYNIDIKNSSGLNPLRNLTTFKESLEIASDFIEKLFLEEKEEALPSTEKAQIEQSLIQFAKRKEEKTIDNFYKSLEHPKREKLIRWIKGSLNENIFNSEEDISGDRLLYFNFENISTASNSYIAKAVIAAIMAEFSFKLLNKESNEKFIFISDETPFFIKTCFHTFFLTIKECKKIKRLSYSFSSKLKRFNS